MGSIQLASIRKSARFKWPNEIDAYLSVGIPPGRDTFLYRSRITAVTSPSGGRCSRPDEGGLLALSGWVRSTYES